MLTNLRSNQKTSAAMDFLTDSKARSHGDCANRSRPEHSAAASSETAPPPLPSHPRAAAGRRYKKQAQEMETDINERKGESTDQQKSAASWLSCLRGFTCVLRRRLGAFWYCLGCP